MIKIKSSVLAGNGLDCRFCFGYRSTRCTRSDKHGVARAASLGVLLVLSAFSTFNASAQPFVQAWGWNAEGECNVPAGLAKVVAVAAGGDFSVALKSDHTVVAWGNNDIGQATVPGGLANVIRISASPQRFALALKSDGTVVGWGNNAFGQINVPAGLTNVIAIAAGQLHGL